MNNEITIIQPDRIIKKSGHNETIIPTHSKEYELVGWELHNDFYLANESTRYATKQEAEAYYFKVNGKSIYGDKGKVKIYPLYKWKKSLFNPYFIGWNEGYTPKNEKQEKNN